MPLLQWQDKFETGIGYIDYEHRRLVDLINRVTGDLGAAGQEADIADCLGELYAQISAHFALEESVMRDNRYGLYDLHKADHEKLLEEMRYMMDAYEAGACETCGKTLDACLSEWFHKHFRTKDPRFEQMRRRETT
jgi:hemerythrin